MNGHYLCKYKKKKIKKQLYEYYYYKIEIQTSTKCIFKCNSVQLHLNYLLTKTKKAFSKTGVAQLRTILTMISGGE